MLISDLNAETMANLAHNIELNRDQYPAGSEVRARKAKLHPSRLLWWCQALVVFVCAVRVPQLCFG